MKLHGKFSWFLLASSIVCFCFLFLSNRGFVSLGTSERDIRLKSKRFLNPKQQNIAIPKRPNILIIYTDDQRFGDIDWLANNGGKRTPAMDEIFENGVWMTQSRVTTSMCSPSRYGMHTGNYASRSLSDPSLNLSRNALGWASVENKSAKGGRNIRLRGSKSSAGHFFQAAGYRTGFVGKWHLGGSHDKDNNVGDVALIQEQEEKLVAKIGGFDQVSGLYIWNVSYQAARLGFPRKYAVHNSAFLTQNVLSFIRSAASHPSKAPFFLIYSPTLVHSPLVSQHDDQRLGPYGLIDLLPQPKIRENEIRLRTDMQWVGDRDRSIIELDFSIGAILDELRRQKLDKKTLVIFMSDNNHAKSSVYDDGVAVPTAVYWQDVILPGSYSGLFSNIDILPTVLDAAGIVYETDYFDGISAWPALTGKEDEPRSHLLLEQGFSRTLISRDGFKYVRIELPAGMQEALVNAKVDYSGRPYNKEPKSHFWTWQHRHPGVFDREQLYNLKLDPSEIENLVDNPESAQRLQIMRNLLEKEVSVASYARRPG